MGANVLEFRNYLFQSNISMLPKLKNDSDRNTWFAQLNRNVEKFMYKDIAKPTNQDLQAYIRSKIDGI